MMRNTLTLDDDVAAALNRRRAQRGTVLPTFDPGRALISDSRVLKDLLDDEDDDRALGRRA